MSRPRYGANGMGFCFKEGYVRGADVAWVVYFVSI